MADAPAGPDLPAPAGTRRHCPRDGGQEAREREDDMLSPPPARPRDPKAPPAKTRRKYILADLPGQCVSVLRFR